MENDYETTRIAAEQAAARLAAMSFQGGSTAHSRERAEALAVARRHHVTIIEFLHARIEWTRPEEEDSNGETADA